MLLPITRLACQTSRKGDDNLQWLKKFFGLNNEGYGFVEDKVKLIMTSDIAGHYENPDGVFKCENVKCKNGFTSIRYKPRPHEEIQDSLPCPYCGKNMVNHGLVVLWSQSIQEIRKTSSGTPAQYKVALNGIDIFLRLYKAEQTKTWPGHEIPAISTATEIATKIFDDKGIKKVNIALEQVNVCREIKVNVAEELKHREIYENFYYTLTPGKTFKQTDLVADFKALHYRINIDPTWLFYVWSNFGLVKRTKEKNRVYLERT